MKVCSGSAYLKRFIYSYSRRRKCRNSARQGTRNENSEKLTCKSGTEGVLFTNVQEKRDEPRTEGTHLKDLFVFAERKVEGKITAAERKREHTVKKGLVNKN